MDAKAPTIGHNSGISAYDEFVSQIADLKSANEDASFDYADPKDNTAARSHVYKMRQLKAEIEKARKKAKAESLEYGRRVDERAKEIVSDIDEMIDVHAKPLQEIEQVEKDRVERHKSNLSEIEEAGRVTAEQWIDLPLQAMKDRLAEVDAESISEDHWEEFALLIAQTKDAAVTLMRDAIAKREKHDSEQDELERLRAETEERARLDREEGIRKEAEQRANKEAAMKAEQAKEQAEADTAAASEAAERRELELKLVAEKAEREKVEAQQRATNAAKEAEENAERQAAEKAEKGKADAEAREADKKHRTQINRKAVAAFVKGGMSEKAAKEAVTLIAQKTIPNIQISY